MSQCVPSWEFNGTSANPRVSRGAQFDSNLFIPHVPSMLDDGHEGAVELTWEKGVLLLQDLVSPGKTSPFLLPSPPENNFGYAYRVGGTLESVVNQATHPVLPVPRKVMDKDPATQNLFPWFYDPTPNMTGLDALVPCSAGQVPGIGQAGISTPGYSAGVGSCSDKSNKEKKKRKRIITPSEESSACRVPSSSDQFSDSFEWESEQISLDPETNTWDFTSTSMTTNGSQQNTTSEEFISTYPTNPQKRVRTESTKKSSASTQRSRTEHDQTRTRDKIKQRIATLQKMVPNSNKANKVAILDEVIQHLRQLKTQVETMNRMNRMNMNMNTVLPTIHQLHQHQIQMLLNMMMVPTGFMAMGLPTQPFNVVPPQPVSPFMVHPTDSLSMFLAYQSQINQMNAMDGYVRMVGS